MIAIYFRLSAGQSLLFLGEFEVKAALDTIEDLKREGCEVHAVRV